jgi:hypothetical protein
MPAILPRNGRSPKKWLCMVAHLHVIANPEIREGWARSGGVGHE